MKRLTLFAAPFVLAGMAAAQNPIGPFLGNAGTEGFETQITPNPFPPCVEDRVFSNQADLCANSAHITGSWGFGCSIFPHSGGRLFGSTGSVATYTFDATISRFGGYFGTNNPSVSDGWVKFYDAAGVQIGTTQIITAPNNCTWTWNGWDLAGAGLPDAKSVVVSSNYGQGGFMMMDDMEADISSAGGTGSPFCFCDQGSAWPNGVCGNTGAPGNGCANSTGPNGANLAGTGNADTSNDTLVLHATGAVPGQPGLFFQGDNALGGGNGLAFGDGLRCAGQNVIRLQVVPADSSGHAMTNVPIGATGGCNPGDTKHYQYWYRDPVGGPCGSGFNLTNGLTINWI